MRLLYVAAGVLWVILLLLLGALVSVLSDAGMTGWEQVAAATFLVPLIVIVGTQLRATHRQMREMTANRIVLGDAGMEFQLSGRAREWKGLPEVPHTLVPWADALSIVVEQKRFVYPSVVPLGYPLQVFTLYSKAGGISFTRECVPNAKRAALEIAAKIGSELIC